MIKSLKELKEGAVFLKWSSKRLFKKNKNIICCTCGPTGSGKSYLNLRQMEIHYNIHFKNKFPDLNKRILQNVCFGLDPLALRLSSKDLMKGELILCEEMGVGHGALDFQTKSAKLFNYVLQSFRNKNIGLLMNLPYFSMLNKTARLLTHFHMVMTKVDNINKISTCRGKYLQTNQYSGKTYPKKLRVIVDGISVPIAKFHYHLPNDELKIAYEKMKDDFVNKQTKQLKDFLIDKKKEDKQYITLRMKHINYCFHILRLGSQRLITEKISEIEGIPITHQQISIDIRKMNKYFPKWAENPKKIGFSSLASPKIPVLT